MSGSSATPAGLLFDLDGTLLDTAPDLAAALNVLRARHGRPPLPFETVRPWVSHGGAALVGNAFGLGASDPGFEGLRRELLQIYRGALAVRTRLFDGWEWVLGRLERRGIPWGVVTNKPAWLTEPLLRELRLLDRAACVVSGDTTSERKPHPAPLIHACRLMGLAPGGCVYVGDAERDVEAGRRAGMRTLIAAFGYLGGGDTPEYWGADGIIGAPPELLPWLGMDGGSDPPGDTVSSTSATTGGAGLGDRRRPL